MHRRIIPGALALVLVAGLAGLAGLAGPAAAAATREAKCDVAGAGIEEAIAARPALREEANAQALRDLRTLRDAAIVLDTYHHAEECERLVAIVRGMAEHPARTIEAGGDTDEDAAERVVEARRPKAVEKAVEKVPAEKIPAEKGAKE